MKTHSSLTKRLQSRLTLTSVAFFGLLLASVLVGSGGRVHAVQNNTANVPTWIQNEMSSWGQTTNPNTSSRRQCGAGYNHAQWPWLSVSGNNSVSQVTINEGTNSVALQFNMLSAICDSITSAATGNIQDTSLWQTRTRVISSSSTVGTITGLNNSVVDLVYGDAYASPHKRYVKTADRPPFDGFTLSGLSSLAPGTHTITVTTRSRLVHMYYMGGSLVYRCVSGDTHADNLDDPDCSLYERKLDITIVVRPTGTSSCNIPEPSVTIRPGDTFDLDFNVTNGGNIPDAQTWSTLSFRLGTQVTRPFGVSANNTRQIITANTSGPFGPVLQHGHTTTSTGTYTAPNTPGSYTQSWQLVQEGVRWLGDYVTCSVTINVSPGSPVPTVITCGEINTIPSSPEINKSFQVSGNFGTSGGSGSSTFNVDMSMSGGPPLTVSSSAGSVAIGNNVTVTSGDVTLATAGSYTVTMNVTVGTSNIECISDINVSRKPYHKVFGGDVSVGAGFLPDCSKDNTSTLIGWYDSPANKGAGTQLAAFAIGQINGFASAQVTTESSDNPKALTFANTGSGAGSSSFGGGLDETNVTCMPDYWRGATSIRSGDNDISGRTLGIGHRETIYVNGNAYISGNIDYASGNYNSIDQIPSFRLIVRGNIYVSPDVTQLDGLFVAMPRQDGTGGTFYTCGRRFGPPTQAHLHGPCQESLTVYGAVVSETIKFTRTGGTLSQSESSQRPNSAVQPAEKFIYTPELWLTSDFGRGGQEDAYGTLPPLL